MANRLRSCGSKVSHLSEASAVAEAQRVTAISGRLHHAYSCGFCSGWHIGAAQVYTPQQEDRRWAEQAKARG